MKKVFLMTAFIALAMSTQAFAVNMDSNSDTNTGMDNNTNTSVNSNTNDTTATGVTHRHHKKTNATMSTGHHANAGPVPSGSVDMNDNATSRQGMPSGETNGSINGQSDDQNYGQPTNH